VDGTHSGHTIVWSVFYLLLEGEPYASIETNKYKNNNFVPNLYYFVPIYDIIGSTLMRV
jgi:hypothetical protein